MAPSTRLWSLFGVVVMGAATYAQTVCPTGTTGVPTIQICGATLGSDLGICAPSLSGITVLQPPFPVEIGLLPDAAGCTLTVVNGVIMVDNPDGTQVTDPCLSVAVVTACVSNDDSDSVSSELDSVSSSAESGGIFSLFGGAFGSDSRRRK